MDRKIKYIYKIDPSRMLINDFVKLSKDIDKHINILKRKLKK